MILPYDCRYCRYVADMEPVKNIEELIQEGEGYPVEFKEFPQNCHLVQIGDPPGKCKGISVRVSF